MDGFVGVNSFSPPLQASTASKPKAGQPINKHLLRGERPDRMDQSISGASPGFGRTDSRAQASVAKRPCSLSVAGARSRCVLAPGETHS